MKYNLKSPVWEMNPTEARKGLEKELRERIKELQERGYNWNWIRIEEILGE